MPIATFHIPEYLLTEDTAAQLMSQASQIYAQVLDSPIERVRIFITTYPASYTAIGGIACSSPNEPSVPNSQTAPNCAIYFEYIVLAGRPLAQKQQLGHRLTQLVSEHLSVPQGLIRGRCSPVDPEDWFIAGNPASVSRQTEIADREKEQQGVDHG